MQAASMTPPVSCAVFDRHAHIGAELQQRLIQLHVHASAQDRVTEVSASDSSARIALVGTLSGVSSKRKTRIPRRPARRSHASRPLQHATQYARGHTSSAVPEIHPEQQHVAFEGQRAAGLRQQAHLGIRKGGMPAVKLTCRTADHSSPSRARHRRSPVLCRALQRTCRDRYICAQNPIVCRTRRLDVQQPTFLDYCTR